MIYAAHSQSPDTSKVWINRSDALRKLAQADSLKTYKQIVIEVRKDIDILNERITGLGNVISSLNEKDLNNSEIITQLQEQKKIMEDQKSILLDQIAKVNKQLRKEKRKRFWTAAAGVATTAAAFYIGSKF